MLAAKGKMEEAREHSESASKVATEKQKEIDKKTVKIDPVKLVRELNALGKYQEAVEIARKAGERNPDHAQIQTWWGISLVKSNKRAEAIKHFILAAKKDPTDEKAHLYWGLTLAMDKKFEEAIAHYRTVLEINPEHSNAYAYWGASLNALGKYEEALSKLDESLALHPLNSAAHALRVDVLYNLSRYDKAWQAAHKAREAKIDIPKGSLERLAQALPEPIHNP